MYLIMMFVFIPVPFCICLSRPESLGVVAGAVYLIMMFVFIPVPFCLLSFQTREFGSGGRSCVPHYDVCLYSCTMYHFVFCLSRPESLGVVAGAVYLIMMFVFIPVPFWKPLTDDEPEFPHHEVYYIQ